jgi:putative MATE family efflux protein
VTVDSRTRRLAEAPVGRLLFSFSLPAIVGMVVTSLYVVIDRAFLGKAVGVDAIAGLTVCMPISFVMMAVGMLIGVGSGALVSIRMGQHREQEAEQILGNAVAMTILASLTLSAAFLLALGPLLQLFGATSRTLPYAAQFMRVVLLGSFFQYTSFGLNAIIRAEGNPRLAMMTQLINAGLNIALDAVFVWGLGFGVTGAAVATVIAQGVSALWTLAHFTSSRSVLKLRAGNVRLQWAVARPALAIGTAPFSMQMAASVVMLLANRGLSRWGGDTAIGAYGIISAVGTLLAMPVFGLNQGAQPIIGFNYGAGNMDRVRRTLKLAIVSASLFLGAASLVVQTIPATLVGCFSHDPALIRLGAHGMRVLLLVAPVVGVQIVGASFFQAIGRARMALVLALLRQVLVLIPLILLLPRVLGLEGLWWAGPISDATSTALTVVALGIQLRALPRTG